MTFRPSLLMLALLSALAPARALGQATGGATRALPQPELKLAPALVPPPLRGAPRGRAGARTPGTAPSQALPLKLAPIDFGDTTIFLRADRLEGVGDEYVEATGKVELRTRRDTVLADWLRYDFAQQEVWAQGRCRHPARHRLDERPGASLQARHRDGILHDRRCSSSARRAGAAARRNSRSSGPDQYKITTARYTTCVAPNEDWYIRMGELDVDKAKMEGTGARRHAQLPRRAGRLHAVARLPAVERPQVGVPHADHRARPGSAASNTRSRTTSTSRRTTTRR